MGDRATLQSSPTNYVEPLVNLDTSRQFHLDCFCYPAEPTSQETSMSSLSTNPEGGEIFYSWHEAWIRALLRPSVANFKLIAHDRRASTNRAYSWVFISGTIAYLITYLLELLSGNLFDSNVMSVGEADAVNVLSVVLLLCCAPIAGVGAVIGLAIQTALFQLFAQMLGGTGSYASLFYAFAAYYAPLSLVMSVFYTVPIINFVLLILAGLYSFVLSIIAINAVNQFGYGKAIASVVVIPVMITGLVACGVILILSIWGPAIGDVFSDIIKALETPGSTGA